MMLYEKVRGRYVERPEFSALSAFDAHTLVIGATRYFMGRMTISACHFAQSELAKAWPLLSPGTRGIIRRDIEREFEQDDAARARGDSYLPLGHDCDREAWEHVRRAWIELEKKEAA